MIICIGGVIFLSATPGKKCKHHKIKCCKWLQETKIEVTNIENGVILKITSDKPEMVKKIQERIKGWERRWKEGKCMHEKFTEEEKKAEAMPEKAKDVVCGMDVSKERSIKAEYEGKVYYFCAKHCKERFLKEPEKYIKK
jgi:YHS domain-containing protein/TusA-related sulfurtransferase